MDFLISDHARVEFERRGILVSELATVLKSPQQILSGYGGRTVYQSKIECSDGKPFLLRVIVELDRDPPLVVTAYRTSKITKYWRKP